MVKKKNSNKPKEKREDIKVKSPNSKQVEARDFFKNKNFKLAISFVFIFIAMYVAFYVRIGPVNLDGIDDNVRTNVYNNIKSLIAQQVEQEYPNMNSLYKQELTEERYQKVLETDTLNLNGQNIEVSKLVDQNIDSVKGAFKADNGQTYLNAIDPYHFLGLTQNYLKNGYVGTSFSEDENGVKKYYVDYKLAPIGAETIEKPEFHVWLESIFLKSRGLDENSSVGEKTAAVYLIPVIFVMLSVVPLFFILKRFSNDLFAFFGSLFLVCIGTFVSRTVAGFVDTDAYNVFFPLLISVFIIYGFLFRNFIFTAFFALLAGFFQAIFLWAWAPGWFIFVFVVIGLISYIFYIVVLNIIFKINIKEFSAKIINDLVVFFSFIITSYIFVWFIVGIDILKISLSGITGSQTNSIASISQSNLWPNVLSSVAELNPASFQSIISSVGGKLVFLIAFFGLVFLALDYVSKNEKLKVFRFLTLIFSFIWFLSIIFGNIFVKYTANFSFFFLILLFLPVGISLFLSLINQNKSDKIFLSIFLSIWMAGTIYMSLNGVRFILLLAPAFAISFGIGLFYISKILNEFLSSEFKSGNNESLILPGTIIISILFLILFVPVFNSANAISKGTFPNFDDAWYGSMYKIKDNSKEDAIITSWWDFGHFFATVSQRGVTFDGGSQGTPRAHWVGKLLMENDEELAHDILLMLTCGGNEAHNLMLSKTQGESSDVVKINKIIYSTFGKNNEETREILENNPYYKFLQEDVEDIMSYIACDEPVENFLITSEDMVGKAGVWAHWGSWDFTKKYVYNNYKGKSVQEIAQDIDENESLIEKYIFELEQVDSRSQKENIKRDDLINQWLASYPSYIPIQGRYQYPCQLQNVTLTCQNGVVVDMESGEINSQFEGVVFSRLIFPNVLGGLSVTEQNVSSEDKTGMIDVALVPGNGGYNVLLMQYPLGESLFTKLFFYNGMGIKYFEKFDDVTSASGVNVKVWKTLWSVNETESSLGLFGDVSGLEAGDVDFEFSGENFSEE